MEVVETSETEVTESSVTSIIQLPAFSITYMLGNWHDGFGARIFLSSRQKKKQTIENKANKEKTKTNQPTNQQKKQQKNKKPTFHW